MIKLMPILAFLYVVCPIDIIPDVIPVAGWIDDIGAAVIGLRAFFQSKE